MQKLEMSCVCNSNADLQILRICEEVVLWFDTLCLSAISLKALSDKNSFEKVRVLTKKSFEKVQKINIMICILAIWKIKVFLW